MALSDIKIKAYATLVRAKLYILSEKDRQNENQTLIPTDYTTAVANYLVQTN